MSLSLKQQGLTSEQIRVCKGIVEGRTLADIAVSLGRTYLEVKKNLRCICEMLGVNDRLELALHLSHRCPQHGLYD